MNVRTELFGTSRNGQEVRLFTLSNDHGLSIKITNYGCIITAVEMPDKEGRTDNIVCGFARLEDYLSDSYLSNYPYFGCIVGRYANRIAKGKYSIDGVEYTGAVNNGPNHLHGGLEGFDRKLWAAEPVEAPGLAGVKMTLLSPDGEEGYPGNLRVSCTYTLDNENRLSIGYEADTDRPTIINLTNHSYFNLTGGKEDVRGHRLQLNAKKITESAGLIPTGRIIPVEGTVFDFTSGKELGQDLPLLPEGYDNNFVLDNESGDLIEAGVLSEENSGRQVTVFTTQPGMQLYTGYWIPELIVDGTKKFGKYSGVALETQHYADSPHHDHFPTTVLRPGEKFSQHTIYRFGLK